MSKNVEVISFGCDPEIFVQNEQGEVCSAIGKFGGTKEAPRPIKLLGEGYAVQEDNVLVEFNIPPAKDGEEFVKSVQSTIDVLSRRALRKGLSFRKGSAFSLDEKFLQDPGAKVFGCDPDQNAYTMQNNPRPKANDPNLRSAGGHIALGLECDYRKLWGISRTSGDKTWKAIDVSYKRQIAQRVVLSLDYLWGIPSLLLDEGDLRKQLYGKAGAHRIKDFGVEYRTLSNFWIFRPDVAKRMLEVAREYDLFSIYSGQDGGHFTAVTETGINTNNKEWAAWMIKHHKPLQWAKEFL